MVADPTKDALIRRRVIRNTFSNFLGKFVALGIGFILTPFLLRQFGPVHYGLWMLVGSIVMYGSLLDLGMAGAVTKYVAEFRAKGLHEEASRFAATALNLYTALGAMAIGLGVVLGPMATHLFNIPAGEREIALQLVVVSGVVVGVSIPCALTDAILRGLQRFDAVNVITTSGSLLSMLATVAALMLGGDVVDVVAANIPVLLAVQVLSVALIRRVAPELRLGWRGASRSLVPRIVSFSASLFVIDLATRLQTKTDEIVIGMALPVSAITPYSVARRLSEAPQMLTDQFLKVLLPLASELHAEDDKARLRSLYLVSTRLTLAIFIPIACTLVILAQPVLTVWVGQAYAGHAPLVAVLTLASLIVTSQWPAGSILQGMARHRWLAITSLCAGVSNIVLSFALARPLGLMGVALGTLIPTTIECLLFILPYALRIMGVSAREALKGSWLPACLPAIPLVVVLIVLQRVVVLDSWPALISVAAIGLLVYLVGYLCIGASRSERSAYHGLVLATARRLRLGD